MNPVPSTSPPNPESEPAITAGSLRTMHVVFVGFCTLLCLGLCLWSLLSYLRDGTAGALVIAVGSFLLSVTLVGYGRWFLRKLRVRGIM